MFHIIDDYQEKEVMFRISNHIYTQLKNTHIKLISLSLGEKEEILNLIYEKYVDQNSKGNYLWERFLVCESLQDSNAWCYIKDYIKDNKAVILFNQDEDKEMFELESGEDLNYLLSETCGYEFYVTDKRGSYLMCFNHHDILYGCGLAQKWVEIIKNK